MDAIDLVGPLDQMDSLSLIKSQLDALKIR